MNSSQEIREAFMFGHPNCIGVSVREDTIHATFCVGTLDSAPSTFWGLEVVAVEGYKAKTLENQHGSR